MRSILIALAVLTLLPRGAAADGVTVSGAPAADRDAIVASIEGVRSLMTVCWQRKPPAAVKITVAVAASGEVTKATAKTKGAAAQCAAGLLAVSTLAPGGKAWKGTVEIASVSEGKAADVRAIHDGLSARRDSFFACQAKDAAFVGKLVLRVTVQQDGSISDATGVIKEGSGGKSVATCVAAAAKKLRLSAIGSAQVTYELTLSYAGGSTGGGGASDGDGVVDASLQPSKKGPHDADAIRVVIRGKKAAVVKCVKKSSARGKLTVRIEIGADGKVVKATVKASEIDDATVEDCVLAVFRTMKFATADDRTVVIYPFKIADGAVIGL